MRRHWLGTCFAEPEGESATAGSNCRNGIIELRSVNPDGDNYRWTKAEVQETHPIEWRFPVVEYNVKVKW